MQLVEMAALVALLGLLLLTVLFAARRVQLLRGGGTQAVLRPLPAADERGWRNGVLRYGEEELVFFRVSSLRVGADRRVARRSLVVVSRRALSPAERDLVLPDATVLQLRDDAGEMELALSDGALTAFLSWVESSPPGRAQRARR